MKQRIIFGVSGFAALLLAIFVLPSIVFDMVIVILAAIAAMELSGATQLVKDKGLLTLTGVCAVLFGVTQSPSVLSLLSEPLLWQACAVVSIVLLLILRLLQKHETTHFSEIAVASFSAMVIPYMMLSMVRIFHMSHGSLLVLVPMAASWGSDTCAYFAGMAFGKHKLAPVISPKKTIEGAIGGVVGAVLSMMLIILLFNASTSLNIPMLGAAILGGVGAVIGQLGDLTFSVIKRQCNVKDYGHIFPGHGGVLDRFDSVIVVAPVIEILLLVLA